MNDVFFLHDDEDGIIDITINSGVIYISAHTTNGKYSNAMLKKFDMFLKAVGEVRTQLRYNYLVDFFSKHYKVELLLEESQLYSIRSE